METPRRTSRHSAIKVLAFVAVVGGVVWYILNNKDKTPAPAGTPSPEKPGDASSLPPDQKPPDSKPPDPKPPGGPKSPEEEFVSSGGSKLWTAPPGVYGAMFGVAMFVGFILWNFKTFIWAGIVFLGQIVALIVLTFQYGDWGPWLSVILTLLFFLIMAGLLEQSLLRMPAIKIVSRAKNNAELLEENAVAAALRAGRSVERAGANQLSKRRASGVSGEKAGGRL